VPAEHTDAARASDGGGGLSIAAHPRAVRRIRQAKSWGGLAGFLLGGYASLPTHTLADAGVRALIAGAGCYVIVWAAAVFAWRGLIVAELSTRRHELLRSGSDHAPGPAADGRVGAAGPPSARRARAGTGAAS
jgi:hypothetical protein